MSDDFRGFIKKLDEMGELETVRGADWNLEIGTLTELMALKKGPALLFDEVKGYPKGFRLASDVIQTPRRLKIGFNIPEETSNLEVVRQWKDKFNAFEPVPTEEVRTGPVMENRMTGNDIDILKFPVPKWHELDGGRYIGTGVVTITRDPDSGFINCGTYRVMVHDEKTLSFYASPGKHATMIREKYWVRGEDCPVVMCFGQDLDIFYLSGMEVPWEVSELELAGFMKGRPVEVVRGKMTGLPIPATAELVIEGFSPPKSVESRPEGPFGEWTGYYGSGARTEPVVRIKAVHYRNDPIIHGNPPLKPPAFSWWPIPTHTAARLWNLLDAVRIPGIQGVYVHGPGLRIVSVVSIKQMHLGHAQQVGFLAASLLSGGSCNGRYAIVVDDDIDASDWDEVMWAVTTRCDPERGIQVVKGMLSSPLDPMLWPDKRAAGDFTTAKVVINACRPYHWMKDFPPVQTSTKEQRDAVMKKWPELFGKGS
jgi:4-hydroxy-3-polyprenylbenzoate decarboxylase